MRRREICWNYLSWERSLVPEYASVRWCHQTSKNCLQVFRIFPRHHFPGRGLDGNTSCQWGLKCLEKYLDLPRREGQQGLLDVDSNQYVWDDFLIYLSDKSDLALIFGKQKLRLPSSPLHSPCFPSCLLKHIRSSRASHEYQYSSIRDLRSYIFRSVLMQIFVPLVFSRIKDVPR